MVKATEKRLETVEEVEALRDVKWKVAQECNRRVAAWGPELLGRKVREFYHRGWGADSAGDLTAGSG